MQYRKLDANSDMVFGHGSADYLKDSPECVAQAVQTRLKLQRGEWFLDVTEGTPYTPSVLGMHTQASRDQAIRLRVLETPGVREIVDYESDVNPDSRKFSISLRLDTVYGAATLQEIT